MPYGLVSTSPSSVNETSHRAAPLAAGAWVHIPPRVATPIRTRPARTSNVGPRRDSRRGHSTARNSAGPTASVSPAYPMNLSTGWAVSTDGCTASGSMSAGRAEGAPTEKIIALPTGCVSPETIR